MSFILEISAIETFLIRHPVLRKGKSIESCHFDGDNLNSTKHFGLFEDQILVGVISLFKSDNTVFKDPMQFQIRGMAVLENHQKKGYGEELIHHVENQLKKEEKHLIWFNARENAVGFYQKLGYQVIGDSFEINNVGTHFLMYKMFLSQLNH